MNVFIISLVFLILEAYMQLTLDAVSNPEEFVRPLAGSFTDGDKFSTGNTLPLIGKFLFSSGHHSLLFNPSDLICNAVDVSFQCYFFYPHVAL